jgi:uncharacterized C2H2 Zn-finger protein
MLRSLILYAGAPAVLGLSLLAGGCASKDAPAHQGHGAHTMAGDEMMCPKCETVWKQEIATNGGRSVTTMQGKSSMTCPECDAMAMSLLMGDGKVMLHECATCKVTPVMLKPGPDRTQSH